MKVSQITSLICIAFFSFSSIAFSQNTPPPPTPKVYVNPDWDAIAKNLEEATIMGEEELEKLRKKYDPNALPEEGEVPQEIKDMLKSYEDMVNLTKSLEAIKDQRNQPAEIGYTEEDFERFTKNTEEIVLANNKELEALARKYDPNYMPETDPDEQRILEMLDAYQKLLDATKEIERIQDHQVLAKPKGTGQTTGHIADLTIENKTPNAIDILPEEFFIPSNGRYQSYVGRIPEGHTILPGATAIIPIEGYCADVHTPPVPMGELMPPLNEWIPVLVTAPQVPEPMNPPGATAPTAPEPMNPPGAEGAPSVPEPMNPPNGSVPPSEGIPVRLLPRDPMPPFTPSLIPEIVLTPIENTGDIIIVTYPGTDTPVDGTIDPESNPPVYGTILVEVVRQLEDAFEVIQEGGYFPTPYSPDPAREKESVIQQTFWIYTAALTGDEYKQEHFETKVYDQFESTTGKPVTALPEEQKEQVDQGIEDFWQTFQATGLEAKVISADSPNLIDPTMMLATVSTPKCKCDDITYDLEVKRGGVVVHTDSHSSEDSPGVKIKDFKYDDVLDVKISNIKANCACDDAECKFYPAESTNSNSPGYTKPDMTRPGKVDIDMDNDPPGEIGSKGNNNCQHKDAEWNTDGTEYTFKLVTKNEKTSNSSVFQRMRIKSYCVLDDCGKKLCSDIVQLNFVTTK